MKLDKVFELFNEAKDVDNVNLNTFRSKVRELNDVELEILREMLEDRLEQLYNDDEAAI